MSLFLIPDDCSEVKEMISSNKIKHCLSVARLMKVKAIEYGEDPEQMFLLGLLHDVGYEFDGLSDHDVIGGDVLRDSGFKYWREVYYHGNVETDYRSRALDLLNYCDLHVSSKGEYVSVEERLKEVRERHGVCSIAAYNATVLAERLGLIQ